MDKTIIHLLGYLTEEQWLDALSKVDGVNINRSDLICYAQRISEEYCFSWSDKMLKKINK